MKDASIVKSPFFRLLLPLIVGILLQYYIASKYWSIIFFALGTGIMLYSFFVPRKREYSLRWFFGLGISFFIVSLATFTTQLKQLDAQYDYRFQKESYLAMVQDNPTQKSKSLACEVKLLSPKSENGSNKLVMCYFEPNGTASDLQAGDKIRFYGQIEPLRNMGNPNEFDYEKYMQNKGFSGGIYLTSDRWEPTFESKHSLQTFALKTRAYIIRFFESLGLTDTELSIVSALTLGYQDSIPDDIKESFRATGTAHVLAVSGMHAAIIFAAIMFLLSFIPRHSKYAWIKYSLAIILLWAYALVTGFSPSVVRASIMLSLFCIAEMLGKRGFSFNTIFAAAFLILVFSPFSLFDVGFQLSFVAVAAIYYLHPRLLNLWHPKLKAVRNIWQLFCLSVAAQTGTFAICLFYFGYFPTYFFITNLFVPFLVTVITYLMLAVSAISYLPIVKDIALEPLTMFAKYLIQLLTHSIRFFENLPFAKIDNLNISLISVFLLFILIFFIVRFFERRKASALIVSLSCIALLFIIPLPNKLKMKENQLWVYNNRNTTEVRWNIGKQKFVMQQDTVRNYNLIPLREKIFMSASSNIWKNYESENKMTINFLHLSGKENFSLSAFAEVFNIQQVILDASISYKTMQVVTKECEKLNIPCHNVRLNGAYCIVFNK